MMHRAGVRAVRRARHVHVRSVQGPRVMSQEMRQVPVPVGPDDGSSVRQRAIAVLGHESWHLRGEANEGLANCYGFQSGVQIGQNLGLSKSKARAMMKEQLATNASDSGPNTQYRVPSDCRVR